MARIQQLDTHVVNRIAAGEVIERPGSVIKELLENSVDALSTRIDVDVQAGGMELIRVADNGEGIHPEDMLLAVSSHATSKIRTDADLDHVSTLGFRGEALASIASVSRFRIRTRPEDCTVGRELESHGGRIVADRECGCPSGTVMEVHNLFFNTPARRRFMKKASTEFGHIIEQFSRVALANPRLHMVLRHNEKLVYELPVSHDPADRIRRFFGAEIADHLISISSEAALPEGGTIRLWGYVGEPALSRATRSHQFLFLNGRWIQDRSLQHALSEAYRGLLMIGRHPVCFLFLELPPALVDVNVHPNKSEVRFQDGQTLYRQLLRTLREKFQSLSFQSDIELPANTDSHATPTSSELRFDKPQNPPRSHQPTAPPHVQPQLTFRQTPDIHPGQRPSPAATPPQTVRSSYNDSAVFRHPGVIGALAVEHPTAQATPPSAAPVTIAESTIVTDEFRAFQIHDCYIVVASDAGIEVIDQHALHERIMYESLRQRILAGTVESQKLLIPETIECTPVEAAAVLESAELFAEMGFEIQDFGGTTLLVNSCPVLIPRGGLPRIIRDFAEKLVQADGKMSRRDLLDNMLHTMSCRAAIKAGQRLTIEEMRDLLRQRHIVSDSHHCPHGRPTSLTISRHSLDQQFGRLG